MFLQALVPDELARELAIDIADARRIVSLFHRTGALPERAPATVRRKALDAVRARVAIGRLEIVERRPSAIDPFVKLVLRAGDGAIVEAVRIPLEKPGRFAACVSSQVGCALACAFCATGKLGLARNLEAWEIVEQVRIVRGDLEAGRVHGVVFQGMGEPMSNLDRVVAAIRVLGDPSALAIDLRNVTVCTAGIPSGIRRLARELPAVRLGVSLGSLRPARRRSLMPIDAAHPLAEVIDAVVDHARATRIAPMLALTLLAGDNDGDDDAALLADLADDVKARAGIAPRLSLIPFNAIAGEAFVRSERLDAFRAVLRARRVGSIVRYSGGADVAAACGQLAGARASTAS